MSNYSMSNQSEVVRELYAAAAKGDLAGLAELLTEDCVFHIPGTGQNAGDWKGRDGVVKFLVNAAQLTNGTLSLELREVLVGEEHVVALARYTAQRPGRVSLENRLAQVFRFGPDGRVAESWFHAFDQYAVDAFWS